MKTLESLKAALQAAKTKKEKNRIIMQVKTLHDSINKRLKEIRNKK